MKIKILYLFFTAVTAFFSAGNFEKPTPKPKKVTAQTRPLQDTVKKVDSLAKKVKYKLFKKNAHASYYADKFNGRRTASGKRFDNNKYTAAHRKLPFGTKLRVTNEANKKSVVVVINDRGPFTRGRDIDLSKRAFMDIASSRYGGSLKVTIEEIIE